MTERRDDAKHEVVLTLAPGEHWWKTPDGCLVGRTIHSTRHVGVPEGYRLIVKDAEPCGT